MTPGFALAGEPVFDDRVALWWGIPRFSSVETWPGRGWLVESDDGGIQFVHDVAAQLAPGVQPDRRFNNPPQVVRRCDTARPEVPTAHRYRPARPRAASALGGRTAITVEEPAPAPPRQRAAATEPTGDETAAFCHQSRAVQRRTAGRAKALLISLLDDRQRAELAASHTFWVHGRFGSVRLGRAYDLAHRSTPAWHVERKLCVITTAHQRLPPADEWTSMLLTLHHDAPRFFRVANVLRRDRYGNSGRAREYDLSEALRRGRILDAAYLASDLGRGHATPGAVWAALILDRHARLDPGTATVFLAHHAPLLARAATSARRVDRATLEEWIGDTPLFRAHRAMSTRDADVEFGARLQASQRAVRGESVCDPLPFSEG